MTFFRTYPLALLLLFSVLAIKATAGNDNPGGNERLALALGEAAKARDAYDDVHAISYYKLALGIDSTNLEALFNLGMIIQRKGWIAEDHSKEEAVVYYKEAKIYADKAYRLYPKTFEANLSMAGTIGRLTKFGTTKERVQGAWDIKRYADAAYKINPTSPLLIHLLAWWNFELSKPTWFERQMAEMLFGGLPKGANSKLAVDYMLRLIQLNPNYIVYGYDLAKFYDYLGQKANAIASLKRVVTLTPHAPEEFNYLKAAQKYLSKLQ